MKRTHVIAKAASVQFPSRRSRRLPAKIAIDRLDLSLTSGDRLGVFGPNGSGKSTLLRLLAGIYPPTTGSLEVSGEIGTMLDLSVGIQPKLSGRENILFKCNLANQSKEEAKDIIEDACDFGGLRDSIDEPVETYSSGMRMRLAFSLATAKRPEIILLDEWLSVGDQEFKAKASTRFDELVAQASILVLASHSKVLLEKHCNKFLVLNAGRGVVSDTFEAL